jgi:hypothetical protein
MLLEHSGWNRKGGFLRFVAVGNDAPVKIARAAWDGRQEITYIAPCRGFGHGKMPASSDKQLTNLFFDCHSIHFLHSTRSTRLRRLSGEVITFSTGTPRIPYAQPLGQLSPAWLEGMQETISMGSKVQQTDLSASIVDDGGRRLTCPPIGIENNFDVAIGDRTRLMPMQGFFDHRGNIDKPDPFM